MLSSGIPALSVTDVSKVYKLYSRPIHRVIEALLPGSGRRYHHMFHALSDVSFTVARGETVGIIGRNGSGKSTLLQIICGILQPTVGQVTVNGRIAALLELGAGFNPEFTGRENVYLNGSILGVDRKEMDACFADIVRFADIGDYIEQPVRTYSSGMYVRLAFAVAIHVRPDILIVDEALSVGDTAFQAKCFAKFKEFQQRGVTILFVTHSMDLVTRYCSAALLLEQGRVITSGPAKDVVDEYNRRIVNCAECESDPASSDGEQESEAVPEMQKTQIGSGAPDQPDQPEKNTADETAADRVSAHMRESELAYQLNPDENRYGNGKAEIIEIGIDSLSDKVKYSFVHGEWYRFRFTTLFHEALDDPITAYTIKDVKGFDLTGTNTLFKEAKIGRVEKGEIVLTEFEQRMMLNPGGYLLSFGCAGFEDGEYVVYDRRYDVITFEVIADRPSVGFFDLDSAVRISRVKR
ncbi:MAG: ABC transporter ATP-binding protein [Candidatus Electrothrix sp. YB6]